MFDKTEDEQISLIKEWFKRYYLLLILILATAGSGTFGWSYWQSTIDEKQTQASSFYSYIHNNIIGMAEDEENKDKLVEDIASSVANLSTLYPDNIYTLLGKQLYAKALVDVGKDEAAIDVLKPLTNNEDEFIKSNSRIVLARIYWNLDNTADALQLLEDIAPGFTSVASELKGDIYLDQGLIDKATEAYEESREQAVNPNNILLLKLEHVKK